MLLLDPEDRFKANCAVYREYPTNLLSTRCPRRKLASYKRTLDERENLFSGDNGTLTIVEFNNGRRLPDFQTCQQAELQKHFQRGIEDPHLRYIAIEAPDSRSSLSCSRAMFTYLSTYHQIPPSFIPAVNSFGEVVNPKDVCLAYFESDDSLLVPFADRATLRSLGRSGSAIQLSYLLRVVEPSSSRPPWSFIVRPLAVYHSYDIQTGRTLWVTVKGNSTTRDQVCESLDDSLHPKPTGSRHTFTDTLDLHLSLLETVSENWQSYINEIDQAIRETANKASNAKIDIGPHFEQSQQVIKKQIPRPGTNDMNKESRVDSIFQSIKSIKSIKTIKSGLSKNMGKHNLENSKPAEIQPKENSTRWKWRSDRSSPTTVVHEEDNIQDILDKYLRLDMFSFEDNQNLHRYGETIQEAILTIKLDVNVIQGLREFYQRDTIQDAVFMATDEKASRESHTKAFAARLTSLENSLRIKQQQLESLELFVREAKLLYDGVSQYRSVQITKIYAQSAQASALRMEKIAGTTEKETASMHIITFVTLVFLPGTFIAVRLAMTSLARSVQYLTTNSQSFLQSGVFQWKDEDAVENAWLFRGPVFTMFMGICAVMMFVTFVVWFFVFRCLRGSSRIQREAVEEKDATEMV